MAARGVTLAALLLLVPLPTLAAILTVDTAIDAPPGACAPGSCTLRNAILAANTAAGADTIAFNVPTGGPNEVATLIPSSPLPALSGDDTLIDGFTQPGAAQGPPAPGYNAFTSTIRILIDAPANAGPGDDGLLVTGQRIRIRGIAIRGFPRAQIRIVASNTVVHRNLIGLAPDGESTSLVPQAGVTIAGPGATPIVGNTIGGSIGEANTIVDVATGVRVENAGNGSSAIDENRVSGNLIGVAPDGRSPRTVDRGVVLINARNTRVGLSFNGPFPQGNVIGGINAEGSFGVLVSGGSRLFVIGNTIGGGQFPDTIGHRTWTGIRVDGAAETFVQDNIVVRADTIGIDIRDGAAAPGTTRVLMSGNAVLASGGEPIDLGGDGPTPNDPLDADVGPNGLDNRPQLDSVVVNGANIDINGRLDARPNRMYGIEFYAARCVPQGLARGIDALFLPFTNVTTGPDGASTFSRTIARNAVPQGACVTALATEIVMFGQPSSSELATVVDVPALHVREVTFEVDFAIDTIGLTFGPHRTHVLRRGDPQGAVSVEVVVAFSPDPDFVVAPVNVASGLTMTLMWPDGDTSPRPIDLSYIGPLPVPRYGRTLTIALRNAVGASIVENAGFRYIVVMPTSPIKVNYDGIFGRRELGSFESVAPP